MATKEEQSKIGSRNVSSSKVHERRVAHLLSEWSGRDFRRRRVEGRASDTVLRDLTGDVVPADAANRCKFNIEAKKGEGYTFTSLLQNYRTCKISEAYHQSTYDAQLASKALGLSMMPMVFFKPHPNFDFIIIQATAFTECLLKPKNDLEGTGLGEQWPWFPTLYFNVYDYCGELTFNISHTKNRKNRVMVPLQLKACFICTWADFAANVSPDSFFFARAQCPAAAVENKSESLSPSQSTQRS